MTDNTNEQQSGQSRRKFLKIMGGGVILAAAAGGTFLATRTPHKAIAPWKLALGPSDNENPRRVILSHAILAPNPHNRQPWQVDLSKDNEIALYCDLERRLPHTDPFDRQITIGLGCFLELAELTAKKMGIATSIELFPQGESFPRLDERPVAVIRLNGTGAQVDPLFDHIFNRRSNKDPYDNSRSVDAMTAASMISVTGAETIASTVIDGDKAARLREIAWDAMETELRTYRTAKESIDLLRIGKAEIEANPDGIDLGGAFFDTIKALGMMDREQMLDTSTQMFEQQVAAIREPFGTANGFVFIKTDGNTRKQQIAAGRDYVRVNLKATELGVAMQPWSQALQEFPEVAGQQKQLLDVLGIGEGETLQMFARMGYGEEVAPSPRWRYETRIRSA